MKSDNPFCNACTEPDCLVSLDDTCAMIRAYKKSRIIEININQQCTVKLLRRGIEAIHEYYSDPKLEMPKQYQVGDEFTRPLWEIMYIFGSKSYIGPQPPFEITVTLKAL